VLDTLKIIILILAYRPGIAINIQNFILQPCWNNIQIYFPTTFRKSLEIIAKRFPSVNALRIRINDFVRDFIGIIETTEAIHRHTHYEDTAKDDNITISPPLVPNPKILPIPTLLGQTNPRSPTIIINRPDVK
jgi:hypothetical protein